MNKIEQAKNLFKEFCLKNSEDKRLQEVDWYDMSIGFFMALGLSLIEAEELACNVRYDERYWLET